MGFEHKITQIINIKKPDKHTSRPYKTNWALKTAIAEFMKSYLLAVFLGT